MGNKLVFRPRGSTFLDQILNDFHRQVGGFPVSFDRVFNNIAKDFFGPEYFPTSSYPKTNLIEYEDKFVWEFTVTGLSKDDIEVGIHTDVEGNKVLIIQYKKEGNGHEDGQYRMREIRKSSFKSTIPIDNTLDADSIVSECKDGLLTISINKVEPTPSIKEEYKVIDIR